VIQASPAGTVLELLEWTVDGCKRRQACGVSGSMLPVYGAIAANVAIAATTYAKITRIYIEARPAGRR